VEGSGSGPVAILAQHFSGEAEEIREKNYYRNPNTRQCYETADNSSQNLRSFTEHGLLIMCCMCNPFVNELCHGKEEFQCPSWRSFGKYHFLECM